MGTMREGDMGWSSVKVASSSESADIAVIMPGISDSRPDSEELD